MNPAHNGHIGTRITNMACIAHMKNEMIPAITDKERRLLHACKPPRSKALNYTITDYNGVN
jgi:hypothetical protein